MANQIRIVPRNEAKGTDFCGQRSYQYIIRSDLGCYMKAYHVRDGDDPVTIHLLHPTCAGGDHYLATPDHFYIIKDDECRRVKDLSTGADPTTFTLHEVCKNGDFYMAKNSTNFFVIRSNRGQAPFECRHVDNLKDGTLKNVNPGNANGENVNPGNANGENVNPGNANGENVNPGNANGENVNPGNVNPGNANGENVNPENVNPGNANGENVNPGNANGENVNPGNANGENVNPGNANGENVNPENVNPGNANGENVNLENVNPGNANGENVNPENVNPGNANGENVNPGNANGENVNPGNVNPGNANGENVNPENVNPENVNPGNANDENVNHENLTQMLGMYREPNAGAGVDLGSRYHWATSGYFYFLKPVTTWSLEYHRTKDLFNDSKKYNDYPVYPPITAFLPGGLAHIMGPTFGRWEQLTSVRNNSQNVRTIEITIKRKHGYKKPMVHSVHHEWNISQRERSAGLTTEEIFKAVLKRTFHFHPNYGGLAVDATKEDWSDKMEVEEKMSVIIQSNQLVYVWQYVLGIGDQVVLYTKHVRNTVTPECNEDVPLPNATI